MAARRAILESETPALNTAGLAAFQHTAARRAVVEGDTVAALSSTGARRALSASVSFDPDEPLTATRRLPRITAAKLDAPPVRDSARLRRGLLGVAAAATASAALILPSAVSTVTAQPAIAPATYESSAVRISRDAERNAIVDPITKASAQASAAAEAARVAAEEAEAARVAEAARIAEEERLAAEQAAAEQAAAEQAAAEAKAAEEAAAAQQTTVSGQSSASQAVSSGYCAYGDGSSLGLTYQAQAAFQAICARFPNVTSYGGWRASADDHGAGQAIDIMISGAAGREVANWVVANAGALGVEYVIFEQAIWGNWAPGSGFAWMEDRGSVTANHYDHVHVTVR